MKFMNSLSQKKLAKAVAFGLLVSGGMFVGMGQANARTYISGAEYSMETWRGTNVTISDNTGEHEFEIDLSIRGSGSNSTFNVDGWVDTNVNSLSGFQNLNFYIDNTVESQIPMISVTSMDWKNISNVNAYVKKGTRLAVGDMVILLHSMIYANPEDVYNEDKIKYGKVAANDFEDYDLDIKWIEGYYFATVRGVKCNDKGFDKSPVETQAVGLTMLTTGADMLAGKGFDNAASAVAGEVNAGGSANSMTPFMAMGTSKSKVKSGSYVDVKGWNLNIGLAKEIDNKAGKLLIGPVVEYGKGSYDSYLDNGFHGEGDTDYIGGGVMAKQTNNNGFYYEGSLRAGKLSNDYKANTNHYDSDSTYYAAHVGLGKIVKLSDKNSLDYYGKYFYTHQKSDDTVMHTSGPDIDLHFESVDSNRTRLGARFTHGVNEKNSVYAGLAWQHEFSGTARATLGSNATPAPSVKGNTGIMELGWKVNANKNLDLDLGATGYTGKQKGASLNLALNFKF